MRKVIKIVIADDHLMFLEGISALLKDIPEIHVVAVALSGKQVMDIVRTEFIDIVVSDISMPEMDGIELTKLLKKSNPAIKILILSTHNDSKMIVNLMQSEVDGYILKNAEKDELVQALFSIAEGEKYFSEEVKKEYMDSFFAAAKKKELQTKLSRREIEILKNIAMELTAQEIADKLFISQNTVNTHRKNLLNKLHAKNTAGLVKYAMQHGLLDD
jgi:two-component system nitrate/nitrite response regulator NarL